MNILILNGSPKGENSVTLQYINYIAKKNPQHQYTIYHIAQRIKAIERPAGEFDQVIEAVRAADGVIWSFPLYFLLVHAHYKRFIEMVFERGATDAFAGKYAAAVSTSIHYFDHTAHRYIQAICADLGMHFVESFSPDMRDLFEEPERKQLETFARTFFSAIENQTMPQPLYPPISWVPPAYSPGSNPKTVDLRGKKALILYDGEGTDTNLQRMADYCQAVFNGQAKMINLREIEIKSSCLGCLRCGSDNECTFEGKDGYISFFRDHLLPADILIFAGKIHDRYLSSRWKMFFDRSFFNTHTPALAGKQLAFVISGPLSQISNLSEVFQGYAEFQMTNLVGFVSDENASAQQIDRRLEELLAQSVAWAEIGYTRPKTFLGVGGMKIFRDDIYGRLRVVFQADHRAFKKLGLYKTFPQVDWRIRLMNFFAIPILQIPSIKNGFKKQIIPHMVASYKRVVEKA